MTKLWKKYVGDRAFYKMILMVALPILAQNGITNFVNLLDNIMVGQLSTESMSGVAIVNQLIFVFNLFVFGTTSGAGIFTAQYHGLGDHDGMRRTFRFKLIALSVLSFIGITVLMFFGEDLIKLYLNDGSQQGDLELTLQYGKEYLSVILWGLFPFAIANAYSSTLRETEETFVPMVAGFMAVIVNCIGNYILIFGHFGAPAMGVRGAAVATVVSRFVEVGILIVYVKLHKSRFIFSRNAIRHLFHIDRPLLSAIFKRGMPLLLNEGIWAIGISGLAQCYSTRGLAVVAGYNIASTIINVASIAYMAMGNAVGIVVGKYLGAKDNEKAVDTDNKMLAFSVTLGLTMGIILFFTAPLFPRIYNTTDEVRTIATNFLRVQAVAMPVFSFLHSCYFTLRSGGKTIITFFFDGFFVSCVQFPIIWALAKWTGLSAIVLYTVGCLCDLAKSLVGGYLLHKKVWIHTIV